MTRASEFCFIAIHPRRKEWLMAILVGIPIWTPDPNLAMRSTERGRDVLVNTLGLPLGFNKVPGIGLPT